MPIHGVTASRNISSSVLTSEQIQKIPGAFSKGRSIGLEFSTEKKLNNGFYTMLNASIYDAKYEEDGKLYPTVFNGKYQLNTVLGKQLLVPSKLR